MKIERVELLRYALRPLATPRNAQRTWPERSGLLLRLHGAGLVGQGEAAPLPGFSRDTLASNQRALETLQDAPPELSSNDVLGSLRRASAQLDADQPGARAALETAALDWLAQAAGVPAWQLLRGALGRTEPSPAQLPVAALAQSAEPESLAGDVARALERGVRCIKVKVGAPGAFRAEHAALVQLRARTPELQLRLDANQGWSALEAEPNLAALREVAPEYVEEPTADWASLRRSAVPTALDESLVRTPELLAAVAARPELQLGACVLKPMLLGGVIPCVELAAHARSKQLACVLSHAFEGPVGFALARALAFAIGSPERAAGLDAHSVLAAWPDVPVPIARGQLNATAEPGLGLGLVGAPRS